jgi:hypothetical protein
MSARKMCIARWGWNSGGGHFVVVNRYKSGNVYFNNPLSGATIWSYNTFKTANGSGTWTHTLRMDNAALYGSVLSRGPSKTELPEITLTNDADEKMTLNLYPNPAVDNMTILLGKEIADRSEITITNSIGVVVYKQQVGKNMSNIKVNVSKWARGVYMVNVAGTRITKQFIVQ